MEEFTLEDAARQLRVLGEAFADTGKVSADEFARELGYTKAEARGFAAGLAYGSMLCRDGWFPTGAHMGKAMQYLAEEMGHGEDVPEGYEGFEPFDEMMDGALDALEGLEVRRG